MVVSMDLSLPSLPRYITKQITMSNSIDFQPGDRVRLIDEPGEGVVRSVGADGVLVDIDGLEMRYDSGELVKVEHDELIKQASDSPTLTAKDKVRRREGKQKLSHLDDVTQAVYELDLHIHELLDRFEHMSNGEILQYQMRACRSFVREAIEKRYPKIVLIHGVGEGVLRQEIHRFLDQQHHVEYHDAPHRMYGFGATEVIIRR